VVTTWPHCLPVNNRFECTHYISSVFKAPKLLVSEPFLKSGAPIIIIT